jgi:hypothetical protein
MNCIWTANDDGTRGGSQVSSKAEAKMKSEEKGPDEHGSFNPPCPPVLIRQAWSAGPPDAAPPYCLCLPVVLSRARRFCLLHCAFGQAKKPLPANRKGRAVLNQIRTGK